jgi:polyferredoxin
MSSNKTLGEIPVVVESRKPGNKLHWQRRAFQLSVLALLVIIPMSGLFRIDPIQGAFVMLGRQIWFSDFGIVFGFWVMVACLLAMLYSMMGTVFCGWACPQNTLSEWANLMTHRLLGKRADLSLDGTPMQLSAAKNKTLNWAILILLCMGVSALMALIPLFYFYQPQLIWKFVTFQHDAGLAPSLHWIYTIFFLVILVDITMIRHFMCRFMCIYKVWQHTFKTRQTLHVAYDDTRANECAKCNYCVSSCFLGIDPRKTDIYDTCINCGECITACNTLQARKHSGKEGLLKFAMGERQGQSFSYFKTNMNDLFSRATWSFPIFLVGLLMVAWGFWDYQRYHIAVYRADTLQGDKIVDYRISVANKFYEPTRLYVAVEGLKQGEYTLQTRQVDFDTAGRINVGLNISPDLPKGLHPVLVHVKSEDGWEDTFRIQHFSSGDV